MNGNDVQAIKEMTEGMTSEPWSSSVVAWMLGIRGCSNDMPQGMLYAKALQLIDDSAAFSFEQDADECSRPPKKPKLTTATQRVSRYVVHSVCI